MGLGSKIKEVLSGDHHQTSATSTSPTTSKHTGATSENYKTPGTFPTDDLTQRHTDGTEYTAPHGTALSDAKWKETAAHGPTGAGTGTTAATGLSSSGTQHKRLSKDRHDYDAPQDARKDSAVGVSSPEHPSSNSAYWGDLSHGGQKSATHDLPDRTHHQEATGSHTTGTAGRHHPSEAVGGGTYNASPAQHGQIGAGNVDPTESSHFGDNVLGTSGHHTGTTTGHRDHFAGPSGVGIHSSPAGASIPDHPNLRTGPATGASHNPLSSGTNYDQQRSPVSHQHEESSHGHGVAGAGAAAGIGAAAGYGAHEYSHHSKPGRAGHGSHASDGVPRSSLLDPEPAFNSNTSATSHGGQYASPTTSSHPQTTGYNDREGTHGPHGSRIANALDPRVDSDRDHRGVAYGVGSQHSGGHSSAQTTGYNDPEGAHGPHGSRIANAADPRVDSDRDHRGVGSGVGSQLSGGHSSAQTTGYNDPEGVHGPHSSRVANATDPRVDSDRDHRGVGADAGHGIGNQFSGAPSNINTSHGPSSSPGFGSSASPTQSASSASGRKHFGPGHEAAKVLHSCQHCGRDNDISQYFSKDVVYRLGQ